MSVELHRKGRGTFLAFLVDALGFCPWNTDLVLSDKLTEFGFRLREVLEEAP
jgi:hypothetical protein